MKKRKIKRKRRKKLQIAVKTKLILFAVALAMLVCVISVIYMSLGSYDGLGLKRSVPESRYRASAFYEDGGRIFYDDGTYTARMGIDVSYYQEDIDWEKVKADGIDFAMIRLGYRGHGSGDIALDDRFKENIKGARRAGLDVGVYFFSQAVNTDEAIEEARFVIRHIRGKRIRYPVVFDMEPIIGADRIDELTIREKTQIADAFCQVIERNDYIPMVYGNPQWLNHHIELGYLTKYPVWLAHYTQVPDFPYAYSMWQYTDSGSVDGISGNVDMNLHFVPKS